MLWRYLRYFYLSFKYRDFQPNIYKHLKHFTLIHTFNLIVMGCCFVLNIFNVVDVLMIGDDWYWGAASFVASFICLFSVVDTISKNKEMKEKNKDVLHVYNEKIKIWKYLLGVGEFQEPKVISPDDPEELSRLQDILRKYLKSLEPMLELGFPKRRYLKLKMKIG